MSTGVRLVLAHDHDAEAAELAADWGDQALLLTPGDLHHERLVLRVDENGGSRAELLSRPGVRSVLSRLGRIAPSDLHHVHPQDVAYAAAELDALLRAWLTVWPGPVVNRPTTTSLNGPGWRPEQWARAAAVLGLATQPVRRLALAPAGPATVEAQPVPPSRVVEPTRWVTVVGSRSIGEMDDDVAHRLHALAASAGCVSLGVLLDAEDTVLQVSPWPPLTAPGVAAALADLLDGAS